MRLPDETRERSHSSTSIAFVPRKRVSFKRTRPPIPIPISVSGCAHACRCAMWTCCDRHSCVKLGGPPSPPTQ